MPKKIKILPLGNRVLIQSDKIEEKTKGGLVLPVNPNDEKRPETGTVVALGDGEKDGKKITFNLKVGDRVYFKKYSPEEVKIDDEEYLLIDLDDILAIIK